MKKILAVVLTVALLMSIMPMAYGFSLEDLKGFFGSAGEYPAELNLNVDSNIQVKLDSDEDFLEGPYDKSKSSSEAFPSFTFKDTLYMEMVREAFNLYRIAGEQKAMGDPAKITELNETQVSGEFTIIVEWPNGLTVPESFTNASDLYGFNDAVKNIFKEVSRNVEDTATGKKLTIIVKVAGPNDEGYVKGGDLKDNLVTYLPDFTLTCPGVATSDYGTYKVTGKIEGYTDIKVAGEQKSTVNYTGVQSNNGDIGKETNDMAATVTVSKKGTAPTGGGSTTPTPTPTATPTATPDVTAGPDTSATPAPTETPEPDDGTIKLKFDLGGLGRPIGSIVFPEGSSGEIALDDIEVPTEEGYQFDGWFLDPNFTQPVPENFTFDDDVVIYAKWIRTSAPETLNSEEHFAYIIGYPDGSVKPENNISRAEIATIFYRLLKADYRDSIFTSDNSYTDVPKAFWANKAISSISKGGYMNGYEDGSFDPDAYITRAEFATVASRFYDAPATTRKPFSDVSGHWAEDNINAIATMGLVNGYEDGTFRPDDYITRAEAMTIFNRILVRYVDAEGLHQDAVTWPDNPTDAWYYYQVEEATNSHDYARVENSYYEEWAKIIENKIIIDKEKYEDPDK